MMAPWRCVMARTNCWNAWCRDSQAGVSPTRTSCAQKLCLGSCGEQQAGVDYQQVRDLADQSAWLEILSGVVAKFVVQRGFDGVADREVIERVPAGVVLDFCP